MITASEAALRASPSRGANARLIKIAAVTAYALLVLVSPFIWQNAVLRQMLVVPLVIATSAVAAGVCLFATRVRTQAGNLIWTWFGAAAITTTLSQLVGYLPPTNLSMMTSHAL